MAGFFTFHYYLKMGTAVFTVPTIFGLSFYIVMNLRILQMSLPLRLR